MPEIVYICSECNEKCEVETIHRNWTEEYGFEYIYTRSECCGAEVKETSNQNTVSAKDFFNKVLEDFAKASSEIARREHLSDDN